MKLLVYGINYSPEPTGIGKVTGDMCAWLAARGHEVEVITTAPHYPAWRVDDAYRGRQFVDDQIAGVRVLRAPVALPRSPQMTTKRRIVFELSFVLSSLRYWLPRFVRRSRYDAVIAICPPAQLGILPWLYSRVRRVPWVFHIQDLQIDLAVRLGMLRPSLLTRLLYRVETGLLRRATHVATITEQMRARVIEKGADADSTWLLPNWTDLDVITPGRQDTELRLQTFGAAANETLVMHAGNIGEKQGLDLVLDAAELLRHREDITFAIVGDGAARERLQTAAFDRSLYMVGFYPLQAVELLSDLINSADMHLVVQQQASADLVMPSKLNTILAAGRPTVATAEPGTALYSTLVDHDCGVVVEHDDAAALAAAIEALADAPEQRTRMGVNARRYAEQHLGRDVVLARFESQLAELVRG